MSRPGPLPGSVRWALGGTAAVTALVLLAITFVGADPECARWRRAFAGMGERTIRIEAGGRTLPVIVKVADTSERQAAGFQCATPEEIQRTLILFDFGQEIQTSFHMQNVPAPLDIAFAKADGRIFSIMVMAPSPTALYAPMGPFRWALEAPAGYFARQGIRQGEARLLVGR